jgi:amino acid transporter
MGATSVKENSLEVVSPEGHGSTLLKRDSLGLSAVFFCIATAAAPMTAMLFNVPVIVSGAGWAVPAAFIVALVMLAIFTVGYVEMARRVTSAGGFYSFVSHGFGQIAGLGTASVITFSYTILTASIVGIFAYFAQTTIQDWTHANIPVLVFLLFAVVVNVVFAYFDIRITARVLGVFFVAEVTVLLVFAIAVLVQGGASGLTAAPFNPFKLIHNHAAITVFGAAAPGVALFGAFWSWVGFEMATNYGEESRQPKQIFSRATFGTLLALGALYVFVSYAFTIAWGTGHVAQGVNAQFQGKTISAFYPVTGQYFGVSLTDAFRLLIVTSSFACQLAFFNTSSRYVYALGRERILPGALGRTQATHRTPYVASAVVAVAITIWILLFYISDSSTSAVLLKLATWTPIIGVFGLLLVQALTSFAIVWYFRKVAPEHGHVWKTLIAPILGGLLMLFSAWLLFDNRAALSGAGKADFIRYGPWLILAAFVLGIGAALWFRARDATRYEAVGRFVHEEA